MALRFFQTTEQKLINMNPLSEIFSGHTVLFSTRKHSGDDWESESRMFSPPQRDADTPGSEAGALRHRPPTDLPCLTPPRAWRSCQSQRRTLAAKGTVSPQLSLCCHHRDGENGLENRPGAQRTLQGPATSVTGWRRPAEAFPKHTANRRSKSTQTG